MIHIKNDENEKSFNALPFYHPHIKLIVKEITTKFLDTETIRENGEIKAQ